MSIKSFENYSLLSSLPDLSDTEISGRYSFQADAERRIIVDILAKLRIDSKDSLLEVGCGPGNLLIPLSYFVERAAGIDNDPVISRLKIRLGSTNTIHLISGNFLDMPTPKFKYSKILIYSVVHYLDNEETVKQFLLKAFELVEPGGRVLLGDLPNMNKKARFVNTERGKSFAKDWEKLLSHSPEHQLSTLPSDDRLVSITDSTVMGLQQFARDMGIESYLLPQPDNLPFGHTREDLLFVFPS